MYRFSVFIAVLWMALFTGSILFLSTQGHAEAQGLQSFRGSQDHLQSSRPQGMFGEGHAENHAHYEGLRSKSGSSCCNGADCRPTTARWNNATGVWEALVQGKWQAVKDPSAVLDDVGLEAQGHPRWDQQSHVCTAQSPGPDGTYRVYCVIIAPSGN